MDLTVTQTLANFTALKWLVPHAGGAFPSIIDRFLTSQPPDVQARSRAAYATRLWWDVAGPVFPRQVLGLLGYGVPVRQVVYGSVGETLWKCCCLWWGVSEEVYADLVWGCRIFRMHRPPRMGMKSGLFAMRRFYRRRRGRGFWRGIVGRFLGEDCGGDKRLIWCCCYLSILLVRSINVFEKRLY